ncbi:hypothetical protein F1880_005044 [Penicillium rolfsii]|nr:hypothetical protein F1880_005044 [Penicillium rolfsii]
MTPNKLVLLLSAPLESPFWGKVREAGIKRPNGSRQPDEPQRWWIWVPVSACTRTPVDSSSLTAVRGLQCCPVHAHFFGLWGLDARGLRPNGELVHGGANAVLTAPECTAKTCYSVASVVVNHLWAQACQANVLQWSVCMKVLYIQPWD